MKRGWKKKNVVTLTWKRLNAVLKEDPPLLFCHPKLTPTKLNNN